MAYKDTLKKIQDEAYSSGGKSSTYDSEVARANKVLAARKAAGQDTSAQDKYLNELKTSHNTGSVRGQAYSSGADPNNVDVNYVNALSGGNAGAYVDSLTSKKTTAGTTGSSVMDNTGRYDEMFDEQAAAQAAAIKAARDNTISGYNQQIGAAPGQYQPLRNQSSAGGAVRAKGIKEAMAASGQGNSGANLTAQSSNNAQTTGEIAGYNLQQSDLVNKLKTAIADVTNSASLQEVQSNAEINAQRIQAAINETNRVSDTNYNRSQDTFGNNISLAGITGMYNGAPTMQGKQFDLQAESTTIENEMNRIKMQMLQDPNSPENQMNNIKLAQMQFDLQQAQELAKYAPQEAQLKIQQIKAQIAATNRSNQPSAPKQSDRPGLSYTGYYNQLQDMVKESYPVTHVDSEGNREVIRYTPKYKPEYIIQKIRELPLTPEEKAQLANDLGL